MPQMIRRKIKWATKRRKGGTRVWKTKWILVAQKSGVKTKPAEKPAAKG